MYTSEDEARFKIYAKVHLRSKNELSDIDKIPALNKKLTYKWVQLFINIGIILVFGFMYFTGISTFGDLFYYAVFGVFVINIALISVQQRQIKELIGYLEYRIQQEDQEIPHT